ncbi:BnaA04g20770D [Brassica napus]|uniref:BnaA04g20770D protein n=1 Tax=Brassica napus TaxID=3708 RepID=A0A078HPG2_BRANA|nr:BnaA04g20770D [Brassica napus]
MEKKVALVLSLMLLMSMNSVLVSAEETATVGQRIDAATNDVTKFFNEHAGNGDSKRYVHELGLGTGNTS